METLVFDGSSTSDRQCVNITILDDDIPEGRFSEFFTVRIRVAEENENETLLRNSWATIQINNDDRKLSFCVIRRKCATCQHEVVQYCVVTLMSHSNCMFLVLLMVKLYKITSY